MKKIICLIFLFGATCLFTLNRNRVRELVSKKDFFDSFNPREENEREEEEERRDDQPDQFSIFNEAIRTKEGATGPAYQPGYLLRELNAAPRSTARLGKSQAARIESSDGVLAWTERGPGNVPGRTIALLDLPGDPNHNTWLAGAATGGIWKTTNGGASWSEKSQNFTVLPISSLAMSASNTSIVYAGTGEYVSTYASAIGDGIFMSADQGETWTQLASTAGNPDFMVVTRIIVDPNDPNTLLASCVPPNYTSGRLSTIQRSTDGGASWTKVFQGVAPVEQIVSTPGDFTTQYAAQYFTGVLKSTDSGMTWSLANAGMSPTGRVEIAVSPVSPTRIFASSEGTQSGSGSDLYLSDDAAATWSLVNVSISNAAVDFLGGQGYYDNTIACDPFVKDNVYFGGVNYFRATMGTGSTFLTSYTLDQTQTSDYITLVNFGTAYAGGELDIGTGTNPAVEIRFGPGQHQKAHRFLVPAGATSGVPTTSFTYQDYVNVPFEVWDVTHNTQLMLSFRDQGRDGTFNLIVENTTSTTATLQSREYIYVNNVPYDSTAPNPNIAMSGGQLYNESYNIWPVLGDNGIWPPDQDVTLKINNGILKMNATTITVADAYSTWDGKNKVNQVNYSLGVHPDHHGTAIIPIDQTAKTFKFLLGNDGGVFVSDVSQNPGTVDKTLKFAGYGYNTSQFYSADKKPGAEQYLGGMQDNGSRFSPFGQPASATTAYSFGLAGDGFDALWHSLTPSKMLASVYWNNINRSLDSGQTWTPAIGGMTGAGASNSTNFPFYTKLANSKSYPDRVFSIGTAGVWVSSNFGISWTLTPITSQLNGAYEYADVEVSRANANIVWAGGGMSSTTSVFVSVDGGKTFNPTPNYTGATLGGLTNFASDPTRDSTAYVLFSFADSPKILRTTNLGQTWTDISGFGSATSSSNGFPDVSVFCLYVRPDNPNILWAGTEIGIVESLDNGNSWTVLDEFPHVAVWDMKGQDNEVVIATHGRGIWTATIGAAQLVDQNPVIVAAGTSPQSKFAMKVKLTDAYDSTQIWLNSTLAGTIPKSDTGVYLVDLVNVSHGSIQAQLIGYKRGGPIPSITLSTVNLTLKPYQQQYYNFFTDASDVYAPAFTVAAFGPSNTSLQSAHPYPTKTDLTATVLQPLKISAGLPFFYYRDVAIVANDGDYVVVEGTLDGVTWTSIAPSYDASSNASWLTAYQDTQPGSSSMEVPHNINLTNSFPVGDSLLFRFRLHSNAATPAWGWSIDDLYMQLAPTGLEPQPPSISFRVFPNPAVGQAFVQYDLNISTSVTLAVYDLSGKEISTSQLGVKPEGQYTQSLPGDLKTGVYVVKMKTKQGEETQKLVVSN